MSGKHQTLSSQTIELVAFVYSTIKKWIVTYQVKLLVFYSPVVHYHVHKSSLPLTVIIIHTSVACMFISGVLRSILILSSRLCLCLSSGHFTSVFLSNILYSFHTSPKWYLSYLILLDFMSLIAEGYKLCPECSTSLLMFSDSSYRNILWCTDPRTSSSVTNFSIS